jgi:hypothetical protein
MIMRKLLLLLLIFLAIGGGFAYYQWNKPHKTVENEDAIQITARQLFTEYSTDEGAADAKYLNRALQVTGTIAVIDMNQDSQRFVILQSDDPLNGVMCTMRDDNWQAQVGQQVSVKGYCSGFISDVKLTDCIIDNVTK